jgi:hypothetical protein
MMHAREKKGGREGGREREMRGREREREGGREQSPLLLKWCMLSPSDADLNVGPRGG